MTEARVREIIHEELAVGCPPWATSDDTERQYRLTPEDAREYERLIDEENDEHWISHAGRRCPVPAGSEVEVEYMYGVRVRYLNLIYILWERVARYRVIKMARPEVGRRIRVTYQPNNLHPWTADHDVKSDGLYDEHGKLALTWAQLEQFSQGGRLRTWEYVDEPAKTYPPAGIPVQVRYNQWPEGRWITSISAGEGWFTVELDEGPLEFDQWRYIPAPWDLAPKWANQWVLFSNGSAEWFEMPIPADRPDVLYVEERPE